MEMARTDLGPGIGDANQRLPEVGVSEPGGAQHRARGRAAGAVHQRGTSSDGR